MSQPVHLAASGNATPPLSSPEPPAVFQPPQPKDFSDLMWILVKSTRKLFKVRALTATFDVIVALGHHEGEDLSYDSLEVLLGYSHRTLQYVVGDLVQLGIIDIQRCPNDRRRRLIRLSLAGRTLLNECSSLMFRELARISSARQVLRAANVRGMPPHGNEFACTPVR